MMFESGERNISSLKNEINFIKYVELLQFFIERYAVFIVSCGIGGLEQVYTNQHTIELRKLGLNIDLVGKQGYAYVAVVYKNDVLFEKMSDNLEESVECELFIEKSKCKLFSTGKQNEAYVNIDGKNWKGGGGLNFVLYDPVTNMWLDMVRFSNFTRELAGFRVSAKVDKLKNYKKDHPDVFVASLSMVQFPTDDLSENEMFIRDHSPSAKDLQGSLIDKIILNKYFSLDEIREVLNEPNSYLDVNGIRKFEDHCGNLVNTMVGHRVTIGQPKKYKRTIFLVGGCEIFGYGSSDSETIASNLQKLVTKLIPEHQFIVHNYGYFLQRLDSVSDEEIDILYSLPVKTNDIVLCAFGHNDEMPFIDIRKEAKRPHNRGEIFFDKNHYTLNGNRLIAEKIFEKMMLNNWFQEYKLDVSEKSIYNNFNKNDQAYLKEYKQILCELYEEKLRTIIGSIVMNCNPFTLGHRYLIEQAASQVDHLIIFVVQEDKSEFLFEDRLMLVDQGVADIKNVTVIPSGRFIISSLTFSEYFNKSEIQEREIDATLDVTIFAREIAPCLNISVRFVGEEPFDHVTQQYNDAMCALLPQYGIQFVEIPRIESLNHIPISASLVRKLLKEKNFIEIAKIVPRTTLEYLEKRYH